jgi:FkbM family methyltransferase
MYVLKGDKGLSQDLLADGVREEEALHEFDALLEPGLTVLDIGANLGYYALREAAAVGPEGMVYAVEPFGETYNVLKQNVSLNNFANVQLFNLAILDKEGDIDFFTHKERNLNSIVRSASGVPTGCVKVHATTADNLLIGKKAPSVVRMDVEGAEYRILLGMRNLLAGQDLRRMFIEYHPHIMPRDQSLGTLKMLADSGFSLRAIVHSVSNYHSILCRMGLQESYVPPHKTLEEVISDDDIVSGRRGAFYLFVEKAGEDGDHLGLHADGALRSGLPAVRPGWVEMTWRRMLLYIGYHMGLHRLRVLKRYHLPYVLNVMGLVGEGAEIGVAEGCFSETLLKYWKGRKLYSIDPWKEFSQQEYRDITNVGQAEQDARYERALTRLQVFRDRSIVLREKSEDAAARFRDGQLDFVYIDAQHHYEAVKQDLALWLPKIRRGGILAGHDYIDGTLPEGEYGVKRAVVEFVEQNGLRVVQSCEKDFPSWFVFLD